MQPVRGPVHRFCFLMLALYLKILTESWHGPSFVRLELVGPEGLLHPPQCIAKHILCLLQFTLYVK